MPDMDPHRRPPVIDMTPDGSFREAPAAVRRGTWLDRALLKLGGVAVLATVLAGGLALAALAVLAIGVLIPVVLVAGAVAFGSLWWRMRRARREGRPFVMVYRR